MSGRIDKMVEKAEVQVKGMKDLGTAIPAGVPFSATEVAQKAATVAEINNTQESAKATLKSSTKQLGVEARLLNTMVSRNVSFFQGKFGKDDTRLPKLSGTVLVPHGGRRRSATPPK